MPLSQQDRLFLQDAIQFAWLSRIVTAHALAHGGAHPMSSALGDKAFKAYFPDEPAGQIKKRVLDSRIGASVQAAMTVRIFAEFVGALEDTGAFVRAIRLRSQGGILRNNFSYDVRKIPGFYRCVFKIEQPTLSRIIGTPSPAQFRRYRGAALYRELQQQHVGMARQIRQAAKNYLTLGRSRVYKLNTGRLRDDWRSNVHVVVAIRDSALPTPKRDKGILVVTYDKIKHGFNVLQHVNEYVRLPRRPDAIEVVKLPLRWDSVSKLLTNIERLGVLRSRIAGLLLKLDDEELLDTDPASWPPLLASDQH